MKTKIEKQDIKWYNIQITSILHTQIKLTRDKKGHFIIRTGSIQQKYIKTVYICMHLTNNTASKFIKQKVSKKITREIDKYIIITVALNTSFLVKWNLVQGQQHQRQETDNRRFSACPTFSPILSITQVLF